MIARLIARSIARSQLIMWGGFNNRFHHVFFHVVNHTLNHVILENIYLFYFLNNLNLCIYLFDVVMLNFVSNLFIILFFYHEKNFPWPGIEFGLSAQKSSGLPSTADIKDLYLNFLHNWYLSFYLIRYTFIICSNKLSKSHRILYVKTQLSVM